MTKREAHRLRAILTARVVELERPTPRRDTVTVDRNVDLVEEIQAGADCALMASNLDREHCQPPGAARGSTVRCLLMRCQALDRDAEKMPTAARNFLVLAA